MQPDPNFAKSKVKIARVIARLNIGGPAIQAILLTDAFRKRGYSSDLLVGEVPCNEVSMEYMARDKGITFIRISSMSRSMNWWRDLTSLTRLIKFFRKARPSLVHTHTAKAGALGRLAAMMCKVPARVHTFHGHVFYGYFPPSITKVYIWIERFLARYTDAIIAISDRQRRDLVEIYKIADAEKVYVVPLGLELDRFLRIEEGCGRFRRSIGCSDAISVITWIGRLTDIKRPSLFMDVARGLSVSEPWLHFAIVGDGELYQNLQEECRAEPGLPLSLVGARTDLADIYADSSVVVLTSRNEGTPVVLIEAMASAKPFISTDVGGVRDLMIGTPDAQAGFEVFQNGILCKPDVETVTAAVRYLLSRPEIGKKMGKAGRDFVRKKYSSETLTNNLESLYLKIITVKLHSGHRTQLTKAL